MCAASAAETGGEGRARANGPAARLSDPRLVFVCESVGILGTVLSGGFSVKRIIILKALKPFESVPAPPG